jgi:hypothetical protein
MSPSIQITDLFRDTSLNLTYDCPSYNGLTSFNDPRATALSTVVAAFLQWITTVLLALAIL